MDTPQQQDSPDSFPIVGMGASAGGIDALRHFFEHLPEGSGMAFVVILHLMREKESTLAALLQQHTVMPVEQVTEQMAVKPDHVYVIPPGQDLSMTNGAINLLERERKGHKHAPVDLFLRTLARTHGADAVGIILSGSGSDGTLGLKAIKEAGGLTIVQDAQEAEYDGMPRSAIETGLVDLVLPVREMAERLVEYQRHAERIQLPEDAEALPEDDTDALRKILTQLRSRVGHDFNHYKRSTLLRRISRRMQINEVETLSDYLGLLRHQEDEARLLFKDLLISVTNFFRDPEAFTALEQIIPKLFAEKSAGDQVRVWVPGCATGEEAFSIATLLAEHAATLDTPPQIQIFASDIDEDALLTAREGLYPDAIAADVSEERLKRFFDIEGSQYRVSGGLREHVLFAAHNLLRDPPFSKLDLVACRNLLIYLSREMHERVFELFHYALRPNGYLFLGSSESADGLNLFRTVDKLARLYQCRDVPRQTPNLPDLPLTHVLPKPRHPQTQHGPASEQQSPGFGDMHQRMLEHYAPPSVIVDDNHEIVHLSNTAGRYLQMTGGTPSMNILRIARPELQGALRTILFQALHEGQPAVARGIEVRFNGDIGLVDVIARPAGDKDFEGFALVLFSEIAVTEANRADDTDTDPDPAMRHLEAELRRTRERLQATVEEFESSREEMKAQNEELQSVNEEYKTTTEELETSKEELQSVNEELQTVNQELKNKVDEVSQAHSDLQNLMAATEIATLFLDRDLRIKRYTPCTTDLFNMVPGDRGRPLAHMTHQFDGDDLVGDAEQVLRTLVPIEKEMESKDGNWYFVTLRPYRTVEDKIEGVVLTFVDFTRRKEAEEATRRGTEQYGLVIDSIREYAIFTMDEEGTIATWTAEAEGILGWSEEEIVGKPAALLFTEEDRAAGVPEQELAQARQTGDASDDRWHVRQDDTRFWANGVMSAMYDDDGTLRGFVKVLRDNTARKAAEEALQTAKDRFQTVAETVPDIIFSTDTDINVDYLNPRWAELTGASIEEGFDASWRDFLHADDLDRVRTKWHHARETGTLYEDRQRLRTAAGSYRWVLVRARPIRNEDDTIARWFGTATDIDDLVRAEEEIKILNTTLEQRVQQRTEQVRSLTAALTLAEQQERRRIAQILHDDLQQMLYGLEMSVQQLRRLDDPQDQQRFYDQIDEILDQAVETARSLTVDLSPPVLHGEGFGDALQWLAARMKQVHNLQVTIDAKETIPAPSEDQHILLYQTVRELLFNVVKHAGVGHAHINIARTDGQVVIRVSDGGKGFDPTKAFSTDGKGTGLGLSSIQERLNLFGGKLSVESNSGDGTQITITMPYDPSGTPPN